MHNLTFFSFSFFSSRFFFLLGLSGSDFHVFMFSPLSLVKADPVNKLELHYLVHRDSGGKFGAFNGGRTISAFAVLLLLLFLFSFP